MTQQVRKQTSTVEDLRQLTNKAIIDIGDLDLIEQGKIHSTAPIGFAASGDSSYKCMISDEGAVMADGAFPAGQTPGVDISTDNSTWVSKIPVDWTGIDTSTWWGGDWISKSELGVPEFSRSYEGRLLGIGDDYLYMQLRKGTEIPDDFNTGSNNFNNNTLAYQRGDFVNATIPEAQLLDTPEHITIYPVGNIEVKLRNDGPNESGEFETDYATQYAQGDFKEVYDSPGLIPNIWFAEQDSPSANINIVFPQKQSQYSTVHIFEKSFATLIKGLYMPKTEAETSANAVIYKPWFKPGDVRRYGWSMTDAVINRTALQTAINAQNWDIKGEHNGVNIPSGLYSIKGNIYFTEMNTADRVSDIDSSYPVNPNAPTSLDREFRGGFTIQGAGAGSWESIESGSERTQGTVIMFQDPGTSVATGQKIPIMEFGYSNTGEYVKDIDIKGIAFRTEYDIDFLGVRSFRINAGCENISWTDVKILVTNVSEEAISAQGILYYQAGYSGNLVLNDVGLRLSDSSTYDMGGLEIHAGSDVQVNMIFDKLDIRGFNRNFLYGANAQSGASWGENYDTLTMSDSKIADAIFRSFELKYGLIRADFNRVKFSEGLGTSATDVIIYQGCGLNHDDYNEQFGIIRFNECIFASDGGSGFKSITLGHSTGTDSANSHGAIEFNSCQNLYAAAGSATIYANNNTHDGDIKINDWIWSAGSDSGSFIEFDSGDEQQYSNIIVNGSFTQFANHGKFDLWDFTQSENKMITELYRTSDSPFTWERTNYQMNESIVSDSVKTRSVSDGDKEVGWLYPSSASIAGSVTPGPEADGRVLLIDGAGANVITLDYPGNDGSWAQFMVVNAGTSTTLVTVGGTTMYLVTPGSFSGKSTITAVEGSIINVYWKDSDEVYVFGSGLV